MTTQRGIILAIAVGTPEHLTPISCWTRKLLCQVVVRISTYKLFYRMNLKQCFILWDQIGLRRLHPSNRIVQHLTSATKNPGTHTACPIHWRGERKKKTTLACYFPTLLRTKNLPVNSIIGACNPDVRGTYSPVSQTPHITIFCFEKKTMGISLQLGWEHPAVE